MAARASAAVADTRKTVAGSLFRELMQVLVVRNLPLNCYYNGLVAASRSRFLHEPRLRRSVVSFSAGIHACAKVGQWQFALTLLEERPQAPKP